MFVMENVKALGTMPRWRLLREALVDAFAAAGYETEMRVLNAAHYGVPQLRERAFFVGSRGGEYRIRFPRRSHLSRQVTAREAFAGLPEPGAPGNEGECTAIITIASKPVLRRSPYAGMLLNGQGRPIDLNRPAPTIHASAGGNKTPIIDLKQLLGTGRPWIERYHGRLMNGSVSTPNERPPTHLRRITIRESALIQSFPDSFKFSGKRSSQYRQIGNAVPPKLAKVIARELLRSLQLAT